MDGSDTLPLTGIAFPRT